jgi:hypothetical protein
MNLIDAWMILQQRREAEQVIAREWGKLDKDQARATVAELVRLSGWTTRQVRYKLMRVRSLHGD